MRDLYSSIAVSALALALAVPSVAHAGVTIEIAPSSAPNAFGSPSWAPYTANALNALQNGLANVGDRDVDPSAYEVLDKFAPGDIMVTSFNSWRGQANPPAPFDNELGNRLHFGLHAYGDGNIQFRLEDLTFDISSSDTQNDSGFGGAGSLGYSGGFVGLAYTGSTRFGIDWGIDRIRGNADDIVYSSGNGATLVDELVYIGVGNALWPGGPGDLLSGQAAIDATFDFINDTIASVTGSYSIVGSNQQIYSASVTLYQTPEPAALALFGLGLAGLALRRRRR